METTATRRTLLSPSPPHLYFVYTFMPEQACLTVSHPPRLSHETAILLFFFSEGNHGRCRSIYIYFLSTVHLAIGCSAVR